MLPKTLLISTLVTLALASAASAAPSHLPTPARSAPQIVGGRDAQIADWPSIAYLMSGWDQDGDGKIESAASCTGTVIDKSWIVTAAHCAYRPDGQPVDAMLTLTGVADVNDPSGEAIRADKLVVDPDWDPSTLHGDALLVHLETPSSRPAMPLADAAKIGDYVSYTDVPNAAGWGTTDEDSTVSTDVLQEAVLALQSDDTCAAFAGADYDAATQTCAGTPNTSGACHGDSGGPLVVFDKATDSPRLWGLTSYGPQAGLGLKPCDLQSPAIYSWVPAFATWINGTVHPAPPGGGGNPGGGGGGTPGGGGGTPGGGTPGGGSPGGGVITPPSDTTAPVLSGLRLTPRKLRAGKGATIAKAGGAKLSFRLSEASAVTVTVLRQSGSRLKALKPGVRLAVGAGTTTRRFSGRLGGKALKPGRYKLRLAAVDTAGNAAKPALVAFTVVR